MSDMSSMSSDDTSSSDEDILDLLHHGIAHPKNTLYAEQIVPQYSNELFFEHFRILRHVKDSISRLFENSPHFPKSFGGAEKISAEKHILVFCWFAGHQTASFRDVADRFDITISSLFRIVNRVTLFLSEMSSQIICWPSNEEKFIIERAFRDKYGFPGVIGSIDGTHIKIDKPEIYPDSLNRKGYFSIQVQAVCDQDNKLRDIFLGYPGSVHDSRVFPTSTLGQNLRQKCGEFHILGDSAYPSSVNLITPYRDRGNLTRIERNFNYQHSRCRMSIEHTFGILKQKFRQLYHIKLRKIDSICHFIRACCVLHNLAISDDVPEGFMIEAQNVNVLDIQQDREEDSNDEDNADGTEIRNHLARTFYIRRI